MLDWLICLHMVQSGRLEGRCDHVILHLFHDFLKSFEAIFWYWYWKMNEYISSLTLKNWGFLKTQPYMNVMRKENIGKLLWWSRCCHIRRLVSETYINCLSVSRILAQTNSFQLEWSIYLHNLKRQASDALERLCSPCYFRMGIKNGSHLYTYME